MGPHGSGEKHPKQTVGVLVILVLHVGFTWSFASFLQMPSKQINKGRDSILQQAGDGVKN